MRNSLFKTQYVCFSVSMLRLTNYSSLPAVFRRAFEQYSGLAAHEAVWSFETKQPSLWVKWLLADMQVFDILQNDVFTYSFPLPLLPSFCRFPCYTHQHTIYTLFCVCTHKTRLHPLSLMCQRLLIMRFLQDGKLQGDWLTAHFKHCSLPLPFLSSETQRMKREWEGEQKHTVSHMDTHTRTRLKKKKGKESKK